MENNMLWKVLAAGTGNWTKLCESEMERAAAGGLVPPSRSTRPAFSMTKQDLKLAWGEGGLQTEWKGVQRSRLSRNGYERDQLLRRLVGTNSNKGRNMPA